MATIRFVATQVLSSDDGVSKCAVNLLPRYPNHPNPFTHSILIHKRQQLSYKTEDVESEEARKARLERERGAQGRTLWEQLEDQKAKKKEEYDAVTKKIFGAWHFGVLPALLMNVWMDRFERSRLLFTNSPDQGAGRGGGGVPG
jgi:hypothetical protein